MLLGRDEACAEAVRISLPFPRREQCMMLATPQHTQECVCVPINHQQDHVYVLRMSPSHIAGMKNVT